MLAAVRTGDILLLDIVHHLLIGPACNVSAVEILDEVICTVSCLTLTAIHQRVGEAAQMTRSHPCLGIHEYSGVKTHVILILLNEFLPPGILYIIFQLNAEGTVIPGICQTAVDLTAGVNKASALTESDDLFHCLFGIFHGDILLK